MTPGMWIGAIAGAVLGWAIATLFSQGPKTPMEAFTGNYDTRGPGCLTFLLLVGGGAGAGLLLGAFLIGN